MIRSSNNLGKRKSCPIWTGEPLRECANDVLGHFRELHERWDNRFTRYWESRAEGYVKGRLQLLVVFDMGMLAGKRQRFHALCEALQEPCHRRIARRDVILNGNELVMFTDNVEVVQRAKKRVPSVIWAKRAEFLDDIWSGKAYLSCFDGRVKSIRAFGERKLDEVGGFGPRLAAHQVVHEHVEGRAQVVDRVTNDRAEYAGEPLADDQRNRIHRVLDTWIVVMEHHAVRVALDESVDPLAVLVDVCLGPINLEPASIVQGLLDIGE